MVEAWEEPSQASAMISGRLPINLPFFRLLRVACLEGRGMRQNSFAAVSAASDGGVGPPTLLNCPHRAVSGTKFPPWNDSSALTSSRPPDLTDAKSAMMLVSETAE